MDKENSAAVGEPTFRITRSRAKTLSTSGTTLPSSKPCIVEGQRHILRANSKRAASDENKVSGIATTRLQHKKRAVLKDVTNILCENSYTNCIDASNIETTKPAVRGPAKTNANAASIVSVEIPPLQEDAKTKLAEDLSQIKMVEMEEIKSQVESQVKDKILQNKCNIVRKFGVADPRLPLRSGRRCFQSKGENMVCVKLGASKDPGIVDIDANSKDPQACSLYAPDIYNKLYVTELDHRASTNYIEQQQHDITTNMRSILVDWLVEVSEEYKLVPDTLYLTVNLIDRFLSQNFIEKRRLQLLGVACMLIASKYEEICAPRVEEFCFITDNTYTKGEVSEMESGVLNLLHFQLSVPTTKTFLRRFIQAAQASDKVPSAELEFLANYLAELTLVEYSFLKFLPSAIAASAVFLARWTLNQLNHPWNPTLEHYTRYKASELKTTVLALEDLQHNTSVSSLNAIREKYRQQKFKCVATLISTQPVLLLFSEHQESLRDK